MKRTTKMKGTPIPSSGMRDAQEILSSESFDSAVMESSFEQDSPYGFHDVQHQQHYAPPPNPIPIAAAAPFEEPFPQQQLPGQQEEAFDIMRNIASYLTLADATSMASMSDLQPRSSASSAFRSSPVQDYAGPNDDWAIGTELSTSDQPSLSMLPSWASLATPATPGLIALSPMECDSDEHGGDDELEAITDSWNEERIQRRLEQQRKQWVQQKLTAAVFSHPQSIRSYCLETHQAALEIRKARQDQLVALKKAGDDEPETELPERKPVVVPGRRKRKRRAQLLQMLVDTVINNVPLSVLMDLAESCLETSLDTSFSVIKLSAASINAIVTALVRLVQKLWDVVTNFNPFAVLDAIISLQFDAMGRTSEVLASGIQSVATGVGSASNIALQRLSRSGADKMSSSSLHAHGLLSSRGPRRSVNEILNKKLIRKLSDINDAAELVAYSERENDGLTRNAKKRVQKMMHYEVSLRPFTATVVIPPSEGGDDDIDTFGNVDFPGHSDEIRAASSSSSDDRGKRSPQSSESSSPHSSPFMATPKSFPPTPGSRSLVMSKGHRFTEDVVYFARDQLRVEGGLESENERTRAMSNALRKGSRLAVFNAADVSNGISLTCGQHVATKVGNVLYCSTRSMVPVLRNVYVYFEMSVLSSVARDAPGSQGSMAATLSVGLSTLEMPLNTLVGAWKGSVGLCSTGQILAAGQWVSPSDLSRSCYGDRSTVGCLVCLDDTSAFETWDGIMATASVTFNVNGVVVSPPAGAASMMGAPMAVQVPPPPFTLGTSPDTGANTCPPPQPQYGPLQPTSTLPLLVPMEEELFPTLTLHSPSTQVMCRFSKEDILSTTRESIGAPRGVTVYAVDGSVMLDERE